MHIIGLEKKSIAGRFSPICSYNSPMTDVTARRSNGAQERPMASHSWYVSLSACSWSGVSDSIFFIIVGSLFPALKLVKANKLTYQELTKVT
jgi:hypothetical protein